MIDQENTSIVEGNVLKKAIFIDRDGTIIREPLDEQIDSLENWSLFQGLFLLYVELSVMVLNLF